MVYNVAGQIWFQNFFFYRDSLILYFICALVLGV